MSFLLGAALLTSPLLSQPVSYQMGGNQDTADVSLSVTAGKTLNGAFSGKVTVILPEGWHAYQNPPKSEYENPIKLSSANKDFKLVSVKYPKGVSHKSSGNDSLVYFDKVEIDFTGKFAKPAKSKTADRVANLVLSYQICSETSCIPPSTKKLKVTWKPAK